ncbi:Rtf2 RING-finger-domain-containing protein [Camillea tinctor]|nr:Rtf2 RING-finger-domain-containing protein [Camillea tinctor]
MGNDGGSIPKRRELVKEAARQPTASELKATALESQTHAWSFCPLSSSSSSSSDALDPHNTVSDWRGRLYNYESVLRCLMPSSSSPENPEAGDSDSESKKDELARTGIKSLRDVVKLKFTLRPAVESNGNGEGRKNGNGGEEIRACPVSMKELGAATKAVYIVPCGHVFAEVAMREVLAGADAEKETTEQCPACSEAFTAPRDVVPVLPTEAADTERCSRRIDELKALGLTHSLKKDKAASGDKKKKKRKAENGTEEGDGTEVKKSKKEKDSKSTKKNDISSRINNSMTASLTAKVLAEQEEMNKRRKMAAAARG